MRVLVTGAAGFIGSRVCKVLSEAGHAVARLDLVDSDGVSQIDVRDQAALAPMLSDIDVVCHFAARTESGAGPGDYASTNDQGTAVLLAAMDAAKVRRLVLASSAEVYGEGVYRTIRGGPFFPGVRPRADLDRGRFDHRAPKSGEILTWEPISEEAAPRPRSFYAASKVAQENYAFAWGLSTGSAVTVLRFASVYGPGAHTGLPARFRDLLANGTAPRVFEDGGQIRDFIHVDDAAAATRAAAECALPGFVPLNIASGQPLTVWEVASVMAAAASGPPPVVTGQYRLPDARHLAPATVRAHRALGFTAATPPRAGLAAFAAGPGEAVVPTSPVVGERSPG
ncbi:NAD-dependent epimerase/dehydratase family protein [Nocardia sp. NPDC127579]|uniref:NAD-dependent epimerase/dehydratase family protein n=1 Tax=Nocardia sp. NPDC127579 TaxID=3345402 RepID=UPI003624B1BA